MDKESIKKHLKDNPVKIQEILESLGCTYIKIGSKRVSCCNPEEGSDNKGAISIKLNDSLSTSDYTRPAFQQISQYTDFFSLIQFIKECTLSEAINYVCQICGFKYTSSLKGGQRSSSYDFLKKYKRSLNKTNKFENIEEVILDESFIERFIRCTCDLFLQDGINEKTQEKFGVSFDTLDNRVVFPIRNYNGKLLSFKGRTNDKDFRIKGIPKYFYYYPICAEYYLYGYYENYYDLLDAKEIYIGEAEKFVLQLDSMGVNNCVGVSKKVISPYQVMQLLKLGKPIVIMFDKDVTLEEILNECAKFKGLIDVYYAIDENNLLSGKESPTDRGSDIFNRLLENKKKYEWGGGIAI
jgi:DNA primase